MIQEVSIFKVDFLKKGMRKETDLVAKEAPLHIFLDHTHYGTLLCSPHQLQELAIGHLFSEGLLKTLKDVAKITIDRNMVCRVKLAPNVDVKRLIKLSKPYARLITASCGAPLNFTFPKLLDRIRLRKIPADLTIDAKTILESTQQLNKIARVFRETGGVHVAALFNSRGSLITFAEDIGRHNAVDKAIGAGLLKNISFNECFLTLSGRLTADIVLKAARVGISTIASLAAAVNSGIEIASRANITLIGFARGKRLNIYTNPQRVLMEIPSG